MKSFCHKSRSVVLFFDKQPFYNYLNSINPNKNSLLITEKDDGNLSDLFTEFDLRQSGRPIDESVITKLSYKEVNQYLGLEVEIVFFNASNQFDVNAFTAICGTLIGGGELVLLLDSNLRTAIEHNQFDSVNSNTSMTLLRFLKFLSNQESSTSKSLSTNTIKYTRKDDTDRDLEKTLLEFTNSQTQLVEKLKRCAIGHAKRPIVLSANRGRGKSASLGMATAELINDTKTKIFITAPRKQQLSIYYQHLGQRLEELTSFEKAKSLIEKRVTFLAPDEASSLSKIPGLLIIEEAGAIPTQILTRFLSNCNRLIFSTTNDGYEGTGQGFEIRFRAQLEESFPQIKNLTLTKPVRWPDYDLLEKATNAAFLLSQAKQNDQASEEQPVLKYEFRLLKKSELHRNEPLLKSVYQLLVNAHYQTRPSDLEKILSQKSLDVFTVNVGSRIVAASLVSREGPLSKAQIERIKEQNGRILGHLLPQSLIAHQGVTEAASLTFFRIMRIAVDSNYRRKNLASRLIKFIEDYASQQEVDLIGASFSLFPDVVKFWYSNGFAAIRIGVRKDSSTGSHTGEFLKVINNQDNSSTDLHKFSIKKFNQSFNYLVSSSLKAVATEVLLRISVMQPGLIDSNLIAQEDDKLFRTEIEQYLSQRRSLEMVEWQLYIMTKSILYGVYKNDIKTKEYDRILEDYKLIFAKIIQRKSWQEIVSEFEFTGIKQSRERTRLVFQSLFG